jgi:hypothetical protein
VAATAERGRPVGAAAEAGLSARAQKAATAAIAAKILGRASFITVIFGAQLSYFLLSLDLAAACQS